MSRVKIPIAITAAIILAACAPTLEELGSVDYGPYPAEFETIIKDYYANRLKDPASARWYFDYSPTKAGYRVLFRFIYGWTLCGRVNSKNSFGAYTGRSMFLVVIRYGRVVYAEMDTQRSRFTEQRCKKRHGG